MTEYEKAEAGLLYDAHSDKEVDQGRRRSQALSYEYNQLAPWQLEERDRMLRENLGHVGKNCVIEQPFHCDFWERVSVGDNFFANYNFIVLAGNKITIGNNVWIGGNSVICPGVTIGDNVVIGAGSVVTKDIPDWSVAAGNPCRVIRKITEADRKLYFKDREFDEEAWEQVTGQER